MNNLLVREALKLLKEVIETSLTKDEIKDNIERAAAFIQVSLEEDNIYKEIYEKRLQAGHL